MTQPLTFFSVCSGIEAASVAWTPLGWRCVGVAEIEKFPSAVLRHHYPRVRNHGDFTRIDTKRLPPVDILCGGTPCQAFSVAGLRGSLDDARGNLTLAFVDLAHAIQPRNVVWENVPGVLSTKDNAFGCFLAGLVGANDALPSPAGKRWPNAGMVAGPKGRAAWRVLDAQFFGLAQRRKRVIVVADFGNGADPAAVLFEPEGVRRDSPPSRQTGQGVAGTIAASAGGSGGLGTDFDLDGGLAHSLRAQHNDPHDVTKGTYVTGTLQANGKAAGSATQQDAESGMLIPVAFGGNRTSGPLDVATAVNAHGGPHGRLDFESETFVVGVAGPISHANAGVMPAIAFNWNAQVDALPTAKRDTSINDGLTCSQGAAVALALRGRDGGATAELGDDVAFTLRASGGGGDKPHVLTHAIQAGALRTNPASGPDGVGVQADISYTLEARAEVQAVHSASAVRRLTPRECERLQGFPDDYTLIPWRGRPASACPDGPRYKALGNSWAVPKFAWLGRRIEALMPVLDLRAVRQDAALRPALVTLQMRLRVA